MHLSRFCRKEKSETEVRNKYTIKLLETSSELTMGLLSLIPFLQVTGERFTYQHSCLLPFLDFEHLRCTNIQRIKASLQVANNSHEHILKCLNCSIIERITIMARTLINKQLWRLSCETVIFNN